MWLNEVKGCVYTFISKQKHHIIIIYDDGSPSSIMFYDTPPHKRREQVELPTHTQTHIHIIRTQKSSLKASNVCADLVHWLSVPSMMRGSAKGLNPDVYLHHYGSRGVRPWAWRRKQRWGGCASVCRLLADGSPMDWGCVTISPSTYHHAMLPSLI